MSRLIACLIALGALLGLLGQGVASARGIPAMSAMQNHNHVASMEQGPMHQKTAASQPMKGCEDCPMTGHGGKPCNDVSHCLAMSGTALVLPDVLPFSSLPSMTAQRHLALRAAELGGFAAPPVTEPPILSA